MKKNDAIGQINSPNTAALRFYSSFPLVVFSVKKISKDT